MTGPWRILPALGTTTLVPMLIVGAWISLGSMQSFSVAVMVTLYLVVNIAVLIDSLDLIIRVWFRWWHTRAAGGACPTSVPLDVGRFTPHQMRQHLRPYALVVSVHNVTEELPAFLEALGPYRDHLWVIDDASSDDTWFWLQRSGVHCVRSPTNRKKPGAIKALLAQLPPDITTVVVLDPDVRILDRATDSTMPDLEQVIFEFQCSGMAAVTPRVIVKPDGWLARLQAFEYEIACSLGRKSLADHSITSGIAIYRRDALEKALAQHALSVYAEDLRNTLILLGQGEAVYYDQRFVVETEGKRTWSTWVSQRVGWSYGLLKVYAEHLPDVRRSARGRVLYAYHFVLYMGLLAVPLQPLRLLGFGVLVLSLVNSVDLLLGLDWIPDLPTTAPALFLSAYVNYTVLALVSLCVVAGGLREWLRHLPTIPMYFFYAVVHVLPTTVGYLNWFTVTLWGRRLYRDHYEAEQSPPGHDERARMGGQRRWAPGVGLARKGPR